MPRRLTNFQGVEHGDVLLVTSTFTDVKTKKKVTWHWFGVVIGVGVYRVKCKRIGAPEHETHRIVNMDYNDAAQFLDPDEWPDGVHALRMKMILDGEIDI